MAGVQASCGGGRRQRRPACHGRAAGRRKRLDGPHLSPKTPSGLVPQTANARLDMQPHARASRCLGRANLQATIVKRFSATLELRSLTCVAPRHQRAAPQASVATPGDVARCPLPSAIGRATARLRPAEARTMPNVPMQARDPERLGRRVGDRRRRAGAARRRGAGGERSGVACVRWLADAWRRPTSPISSSCWSPSSACALIQALGADFDFEVLSELDETVRDQLSEALPNDVLAQGRHRARHRRRRLPAREASRRTTSRKSSRRCRRASAPPSSATSTIRKRPPAVSCRRTSSPCRRSGRSGR